MNEKMKSLIFSIFLTKMFCLALAQENPRPTIGILTMEILFDDDNCFPERNYTSYIAASYVKFAESGGARVVPIPYGRDEKYYEQMAKYVNGLIFTGGGVNSIDKTREPYLVTANILYQIAKRDNIPLYAACAGFEILPILESPVNASVLTKCDAEDMHVPLNPKPDFLQSKILQNAPQEIVDVMLHENVFAHFHTMCVTEKTLRDINMTESYRIISLNQDKNGLEFVSFMESREHPIVASTFHPEKILYEWKADYHTNHGKNAIRVSKFLLEQFMELVRTSPSNANKFPSVEMEEQALIYNYKPEFTSIMPCKAIFEQLYYFY